MRILIILLSLVFLQEKNAWQIITEQGPEARYINQLVNTDEGLLLFGGKNSSNKGFDDLWLWDGVSWKLISKGPTKIWDHQYVYMSEREQLFVFGGRKFEEINGKEERVDVNDNWIYKHNRWEKLEIPSPEARSSHGLAFDSYSNKVVLFGGRNTDGVLGDTWLFDGVQWKKLTVDGPKARYGHSMTYDVASGAIYLFGGYGGKGLLNDCWVFQNAQWRELQVSTKPSPRMAHAMQFDQEGTAILFGGWDNAVSNEMWMWKEDQWEIIENVQLPQARLSHAIGFDQNNKEFILFGGSTGFGNGFLSETWRLKIE